MKNLNELAKTVNTANKKWWQNIETGEPIERNKKELLALVISELIEALEGERKDLMDDKLPARKMAEVEMADAYIRLLDYVGGFGYILPESIGYNQLFESENRAACIFDIIKWVFCIEARGYNDEDCSNSIFLVLKLIEDYCKKFNYDLEGAFEEKMIYNKYRLDHSHEARKLAGGKKF